MDSPEDDEHAVILSGPGVSSGLLVGRFYYGPSDVAIDPDERWCVMVGDGLVVYRLSSPWVPYADTSPDSVGVPIYERNWDLPQVTGTDQWWGFWTAQAGARTGLRHPRGGRAIRGRMRGTPTRGADPLGRPGRFKSRTARQLAAGLSVVLPQTLCTVRSTKVISSSGCRSALPEANPRPEAEGRQPN